ncbi:MAG TPA: signal peptidase I [Bacillus bacterium]|nr:signal peptidase I [Bacillus sp. (in: firmicutes)]
MKKYFLMVAKITLFIFLLLCCYLIFSSKFIGPTSQIGGYHFVTVATGSMHPEIKPGSLILIKKVSDPGSLKVNDVITFHSPRNERQLITHRIVEVKNINSELRFITKGDSNLTTDVEAVNAIDVLGKYQNVMIPYGGYFLQLTKTRIGFFVFFLAPVFVLILSTITKRRSSFNRKHRLTSN